jgi:nicotinamidase-related amidase
MDAPVLLLMDYQEAVCRPDGIFGANGMGAEVVRRGVLQHAAAVLASFRRRQHPVVHARLAIDAAGHRITSSSPAFAMIRDHGLMRDGDPATAICAEVAALPGEPVIAKCGFSPFAGTSLEGLLHGWHPTELVMGGVATNHVVESAVRHASDVGFPVVVLEDLCASDSAEAHRYTTVEILPHYAVVTTSADYVRDRGWLS